MPSVLLLLESKWCHYSKTNLIFSLSCHFSFLASFLPKTNPCLFSCITIKNGDLLTGEKMPVRQDWGQKHSRIKRDFRSL